MVSELLIFWQVQVLHVLFSLPLVESDGQIEFLQKLKSIRFFLDFSLVKNVVICSCSFQSIEMESFPTTGILL